MKKLILLAFAAIQMNVIADSDYAQFIERWEGRKLEAYKDAHGWSIGVGHFMKEKEFATITNEQADKLLEKDMKQALKDARIIFKNFDELPYQVRLICVDFLFNVGYVRASRFIKTIEACNNNDWLTMAKELKDSKWYGQVGNRAKNHVNTLIELASIP
jgi:lysozyme